MSRSLYWAPVIPAQKNVLSGRAKHMLVAAIRADSLNLSIDFSDPVRLERTDVSMLKIVMALSDEDVSEEIRPLAEALKKYGTVDLTLGD